METPNSASMSSRTEHLEWCKSRAREYLNDGDAENGLASMMSDLRKHPDTQDHLGIRLGMMLLLGGHLSTVQQVRDFVEGFN